MGQFGSEGGVPTAEVLMVLGQVERLFVLSGQSVDRS